MTRVGPSQSNVRAIDYGESGEAVTDSGPSPTVMFGSLIDCVAGSFGDEASLRCILARPAEACRT